MDPDTVIAVGSLVHDLLGLVGGIILCYFGYRLLMRRIKAHPPDGKWSWGTAKILIKSTFPGTLFALIGAIQIWLTAARGLHSEGSRSFADTSSEKGSSEKSLGASRSSDEHPMVLTLGARIAGMESGYLLAKNSLDWGSATAGLPSADFSSKIVPGTKSDDAHVVVANRSVSEKTGRKNLERRRLAAEKKRSRLEAMYQKGTISSKVYKSGEDEYRLAIQRYRDEVNAARVDQN
jgi:hypothetical protein